MLDFLKVVTNITVIVVGLRILWILRKMGGQ